MKYVAVYWLLKGDNVKMWNIEELPLYATEDSSDAERRTLKGDIAYFTAFGVWAISMTTIIDHILKGQS